MKTKLRYIDYETLPSGQMRYRFRRNGVKVTLKGEFGSPEFYKHYAELMKNPALATPIVGPVQGTIDWLVGLYLENLSQRVRAGLSSIKTLNGHTLHLGRLTGEYGPMDCNMPRGKLIEFRDKFTHLPGAADNMMKAVSAMYNWAIQRDMVTIGNPTRGVNRLSTDTGGFPAWDAKDFENYLKLYKAPSTAHTTLVLAISTTARKSDIVQLGQDHEFMRNGRKWLRWRQDKKPHRTVELPMSKALILATEGLRQTPYLRSQYGKPFTANGFGNKFRDWCDAASVSKSLHGVRKGVSSLLPSHGTTSLELDVLLGHEMNSDETKVYVQEAERAALAVAVMDRIDKILM